MIFEYWRHVRGYIGLYMVSDKGRVKNLITGKIRKPKVNEKGYLFINLSKNHQTKNHFIHRLVWEAFKYPIPDGWDVDHLNFIRDENNLDNLRILPSAINRARISEEGRENQRKAASESLKKQMKDPIFREKMISAVSKSSKEHLSKPTIQFDLQGNFIAKYQSSIEAGRQTGINNSHISECCNGKRKSAGRCRWAYA